MEAEAVRNPGWMRACVRLDLAAAGPTSHESRLGVVQRYQSALGGHSQGGHLLDQHISHSLAIGIIKAAWRSYLRWFSCDVALGACGSFALTRGSCCAPLHFSRCGLRASHFSTPATVSSCFLTSLTSRRSMSMRQRVCNAPKPAPMCREQSAGHDMHD